MSFAFEEEADTLPWGGEPIFRDGIMVGKTSSAGFGFTLGRSVALGYVSHPSVWEKGFFREGVYEVAVAGCRVAVKASLRPLVDPKGLRLLA